MKNATKLQQLKNGLLRAKDHAAKKFLEVAEAVLEMGDHVSALEEKMDAMTPRVEGEVLTASTLAGATVAGEVLKL